MRKLLSLIVVYAALLVIAPVLLDIFRLAGMQFVSEEVLNTHGWLEQLFSYTPIFLLILAFLLSRLTPFDKLGFVFKKDYVAVSIGLGVLAALTSWALNTLGGSGLTTQPSFFVAIGYLLVWGLFAPLVEEIFFRSIIQTSLQNAISTVHAPTIVIGLTALFEVLFHLPITQVTTGLYLSAFAVAASIVYYKTRSLLGPYLIHAIGNSGALILYWVL